MFAAVLFDLDGTLIDHDAAIEEAAGCAKPDPRIFALACRKAGIRPEEAVYVGDDFELDAVAARSAGLTSIWLNGRTLEPTSMPQEIGSIPSLAQLGSALRRPTCTKFAV